jgi:hypothetical protein
MVSSPSDKPEKPSENSDSPRKPRAKHLPIALTARAVNEFRDRFFREGKINAFQLCEISDVLKEKGPQEAMERLRQFLQELDQSQTPDPGKIPEKSDK